MEKKCDPKQRSFLITRQGDIECFYYDRHRSMIMATIEAPRMSFSKSPPPILTRSIALRLRYIEKCFHKLSAFLALNYFFTKLKCKIFSLFTTKKTFKNAFQNCHLFRLLLFAKNPQARVVRKLDNIIHRINHYPADSVVCFVNTYPLDSDLSGG